MVVEISTTVTAHVKIIQMWCFFIPLDSAQRARSGDARFKHVGARGDARRLPEASVGYAVSVAWISTREGCAWARTLARIRASLSCGNSVAWISIRARCVHACSFASICSTHTIYIYTELFTEVHTYYLHIYYIFIMSYLQKWTMTRYLCSLQGRARDQHLLTFQLLGRQNGPRGSASSSKLGGEEGGGIWK